MRIRILNSMANAADTIGQVATSTGLALTAAMLIMFALDRDPPFKLMGYTAPPVAAGQQLKINAVVERDVGRECSVKYSKAMYDEHGTRFWSSTNESANSAGLSDMQRLAPNELKLLVNVPYWAPVGKMEYVTSLDYVCNPLHYIWPIEVVMKIETEVKASQ